MTTLRTIDAVHADILSSPERAQSYLQLTLDEYAKDGDVHEFLRALRDVAAAQGGMSKLAKDTGFDRAGLYRALSDKGNPRLDTLAVILHQLGFKLSVDRLA